MGALFDRKGNQSIEYQNLVEIVRKSLDSNSTAKLDRQRLQSAERIGPDKVCSAAKVCS